MSITVYCEPKNIPPGFYLTDCAVSGGTLESFLNTAMELSGGKLCIRLNLIAMDFVLPCRTGLGTPIIPSRLEQLRKAYVSHFSPALMMQYLTYLEHGQLHAVLFDTLDTLDKKLKLAETLGVPMALCPKSYSQEYDMPLRPN